MAVLDINNENFDTVTSRDGIVMIDCWADWCGACKSFAPVYKKIAKKYPSHVFAKIDATSEKELINSLDVKHIPALLLFRDGILLFKQSGYYEEDKLEDILRQAESLDMDKVKAHITEENERSQSSN